MTSPHTRVFVPGNSISSSRQKLEQTTNTAKICDHRKDALHEDDVVGSSDSAVVMVPKLTLDHTQQCKRHVRANTGNDEPLRAEECCKGNATDIDFAAPDGPERDHTSSGDGAGYSNIPSFLGLDPLLTPNLAQARRGAVVRLSALEAYLFERCAPYTTEERGAIAELAEQERAHITATYYQRNRSTPQPSEKPAKGPVTAMMLACDPFLKFADAQEWLLWQTIKADHQRHFEGQHYHSRSVSTTPAYEAVSRPLLQHQQRRREARSPEEVALAKERQAAKEAYNRWREHGGNDFPAAINKLQFGPPRGFGARASSTAGGRAHPVESVYGSDGEVSIWANTRLSHEARIKSLLNHRGLERPTYSDDDAEQDEAVDRCRSDDEWDSWPL